MSLPVAVDTLTLSRIKGYGVRYEKKIAPVGAMKIGTTFSFAPICESQVSRAMARGTSATFTFTPSPIGIVISSAGSCGLNTADILAKDQPNLNIAIIEASTSPRGGC